MGFSLSASIPTVLCALLNIRLSKNTINSRELSKPVAFFEFSQKLIFLLTFCLMDAFMISYNHHSPTNLSKMFISSDTNFLYTSVLRIQSSQPKPFAESIILYPNRFWTQETHLYLTNLSSGNQFRSNKP